MSRNGDIVIDVYVGTGNDDEKTKSIKPAKETKPTKTAKKAKSTKTAKKNEEK